MVEQDRRSRSNPSYRDVLPPGEGIWEAIECASHARSQGRRVVFTNGCFDLLHRGHVATLEFAKTLGDVLIVAINSDASVRRLKGEGRPATSANLRAASIASLACVDCVAVFDDDTPTDLIRQVKPDVLVKGAEYRGAALPGAEFAGRVEFAPMLPGVSTTHILNQMACGRRIRGDMADDNAELQIAK